MTPPNVSPFAADQTRPLRVVVLTCGDLGIEVANALAELSNVEVVGVVTAPWPNRQTTLKKKLRHVIRHQGWLGLVRVFAAKVLPPAKAEGPTGPGVQLKPGIRDVLVSEFHDEQALKALAQLDADLGVVAGTYILREPVFATPRLGSINLHSGKTPQYRGSAPAFWELYNGESTVGITIHRVAAALDAGDVLRQESFPLDAAPDGDPVAYVERYRGEVLRPNGVRLLTEVVAAIANGTARPVPQDHSNARTYRNPDIKAIRELKRRVRERRMQRTT